MTILKDISDEDTAKNEEDYKNIKEISEKIKKLEITMQYFKDKIIERSTPKEGFIEGISIIRLKNYNVSINIKVGVKRTLYTEDIMRDYVKLPEVVRNCFVQTYKLNLKKYRDALLVVKSSRFKMDAYVEEEFRKPHIIFRELKERKSSKRGKKRALDEKRKEEIEMKEIMENDGWP